MPLSAEQCQKIHYSAVQMTLRGNLTEFSPPPWMETEHLRPRVQANGWEVCLLHPATIEDMFFGMTSDVYRTIQDLYCDRLFRSVSTVQTILAAMAKQAGVPAIHDEAIWAICVNLADRQHERTAVTCETTLTTWAIRTLLLEVDLRNRDNEIYFPTVVCVVDQTNGHVLSFRVAHAKDLVQATTLAVYDTFAAQRNPSADGTGGLTWAIPTKICGKTPGQAAILQSALEGLPIHVTHQTSVHDANTDFGWERNREWYSALKGRGLSTARFAEFFDNYLFRIQGFGSSIVDPGIWTVETAEIKS